VPDRDDADALQAAVLEALRQRRPLLVAGSLSKSFLTSRGCDRADADSLHLLSTAEHRGVIDYRPEELLLTARTGTPLKALRQLLARQGQMLPFEAPEYRGGGTLGGAVATGLAGPGRPWWGAVRDAVLGVELIDGQGERLRFGGQVMKNVAGYDVSRLMAGAFGTLGVLLSVSLRLRALPVCQWTLRWELPLPEALARCRRWRRRPLPLSGLCHCDGVLYARLSGAEAAVSAAADELGGERLKDDDFWWSLGHQQLAVFHGAEGLHRASLAPAADGGPGVPLCVDWGGGLRWFDDAGAEAAEPGLPFDGRFGAAWLAAGGAAARPVQARLKAAFDPHGLFNPHLLAAHAD